MEEPQTPAGDGPEETPEGGAPQEIACTGTVSLPPLAGRVAPS